MEEEEDLYYRLFIPLSNKQKEDVFDIWMDNIEEDIYLRKEEIEKYCKAKDCDFMRALLHIYDNIKSKYLCSYINNEINQNVHKYFDFESLGFFLRKRVVYSLNDGRSLNNEQRIFHKEMLDIIKEEGKYNFFIASKNGHSEFIDFGIDSISRLDVEVDEKDLDYQIKRIVEKRHVDNNKYINNITNVHKDEDQLNSLPKLEKLMYLPFNSIDIVIENKEKMIQNTNEIDYNRTANYQIGSVPCSTLHDLIRQDKYIPHMLDNYINLILTTDYQIDKIRKDIDFFCKEASTSILNMEYENGTKYSEKQAKELMLVFQHLNIILAYYESDKQITPLVIKKTISSFESIPYLTTIIVVKTGIDSKKFKEVEEKLSDAWKYDRLIDSVKLVDLYKDKDCIKQTNKEIDEFIGILKTEKKSIEEYEKDRENLINEIIQSINNIIKQNSKETLKQINNNTNEKRVSYIYKYKLNDLQDILNKSITEGLFKYDTRLEDFHYVFGDGIKPKDFNKLDWIKKGKNKNINKKLLIAFCMKVLDLGLTEVDKKFFEWANDRFNTKKPFNYNNKPDPKCNYSQLDYIFIMSDKA